MTEVILNDECTHCNTKECHDGEHFCRQAMKDNSFYKNAKLYKGIEVIRKPTYEELEKENAGLKNRNQELLESCEGATMMYEDLQRAKEIIRELLDNCFGYNSKMVNYEVKAKAEQFLSEVKKDVKDND